MKMGITQFVGSYAPFTAFWYSLQIHNAYKFLFIKNTSILEFLKQKKEKQLTSLTV